MEHSSSIPYVREILIFLTAAGILVPFFRKFNISPVLGFLISGLILGPHGAGLLANIWAPAANVVITESEGVHALAEMGIVFLLFTIGLELSYDRLTRMRRKVFGLGAMQVVITSLVIGFIAYVFGNEVETSMLLGLGFALSSTAIVMQILSEHKRMGSVVGRNSFAILLFQDLSVVLLLFIVGFQGAGLSEGISVSAMMFLGKALGSAALAIVLIVVIGRLILRPLFRMAGQGSNNKELFMATTLLAVIGIAAGAEYAGLSMALGAFMAGLLLAETEYRHDIEITIDPFKGLLLGLFFMSVGMGVDLRMVLENPFWVPASVIGLFIIKGAITYTIARAFRMTKGRALELGLLLGQAGEFAFVVLAMATQMNLMPASVSQFMLIVTSLSMMITPLVARVAYRMRLAIDGPDQSSYGPALGMVDAIDNHVILAGYGRMGHILSDILEQQRIPAVAIDIDPEVQKEVTRLPILLGDASQEDALVRSGLHRAIGVAVLIDDTEAALRVVKEVRKLRPHMLIVARAQNAQHAVDLYRNGATISIPDVIEGSLHVAHELLTHLGVPDATATHAVDVQRAYEAHHIEAAFKKREELSTAENIKAAEKAAR